NETSGDGNHHYRIKVENQSQTTVPSIDGSGHWEIVPNSMIANKADSGGSTKTIADLDKDKVNVGRRVNSGHGLTGGSTLESDVTLKVVTDANSPALSVSEGGIALEVINDLTTGGVDRVLSAEQGKVLKQLIDNVGSGGVLRLLKIDEKYAENTSIGVLTANGKDIVVGKMLFQPVLYLQGIRQAEDTYTVDLQTGLITLKNAYANFSVTWIVEDTYLPHIKFSFDTLNLLMASEEMKSRIELGDVIKILGESDPDDGDHRLVKCENVKRLNGVQLADNKWLNEVPNTRVKSINNELTTKSDNNRRDLLNIVGGLGTNGGGREYTFVQDPGQKTAGKFYLDQNTMGIYKCVATTSSVNNDSSFEKIDLDATTAKLQNLHGMWRTFYTKDPSMTEGVSVDVEPSWIIAVVIFQRRGPVGIQQSTTIVRGGQTEHFTMAINSISPTTYTAFGIGFKNNSFYMNNQDFAIYSVTALYL
ncbi:MAG: hypothetical protein ACRCX2_21525, partial [Paraclostridium sp.]